MVDGFETLAGDVGIDLGRGDAGVAEEFLNDAQVGTVFEEVSGEAVPEHVRRDVAIDPRTEASFFDARP